MTDKKSPEPKKTLTENDVVVSRSKRGGSAASVGASIPGAQKILDPGAKRGQASDADS